MNARLVTTPVAESLESSNLTPEAGKLNLELLKLRLPEDPHPYVDKYFVRTWEILSQEGFNPWVRAQAFFRKGPLPIHGVNEALAMIDKYSDITKNGGRVYALPEGATFNKGESVFVIEGRVQDIVKFETLYLGALTSATTSANTGINQFDLKEIEQNVRKIKDLIGDRQLIYMGARHWHWSQDQEITAAAFRGGADETSTDIGAESVGKNGVGTIPHALETIYALKYGRENAVKESTLAFDRVIDPSVPRIALIDYNNKEITDSLAIAEALGSRLYAVRIDTCGENYAEGAVKGESDPKAAEFQSLDIKPEHKKYWFSSGVSVTAVYALRKALNEAGFGGVKIVLSSGFANPNKVEAFVEAEKLLGLKLFDAVGAGGVFSPCYHATMDIVAAAENREDLDSSPIAKVGRGYKPNPNLKLMLGK